MTEPRRHRSPYKTAAWRSLRLLTFKRDGYKCRMCGRLGVGSGQTQVSGLVCDHIKPHRGDRALFYDAANLQTLCKGCHDSAKQRRERAPFDDTVGTDGWPIDPAHPVNRR